MGVAFSYGGSSYGVVLEPSDYGPFGGFAGWDFSGLMEAPVQATRRTTI